MMEKLLMEFLEVAKKDRKSLISLKIAAVKSQQFELASHLREIERKSFPETDEVRIEKSRAKNLNLLFRMADMNVPESICWRIEQVLKLEKKKKGKFNIEDGVKITVKANEMFVED